MPLSVVARCATMNGLALRSRALRTTITVHEANEQHQLTGPMMRTKLSTKNMTILATLRTTMVARRRSSLSSLKASAQPTPKMWHAVQRLLASSCTFYARANTNQTPLVSQLGKECAYTERLLSQPFEHHDFFKILHFFPTING